MRKRILVIILSCLVCTCWSTGLIWAQGQEAPKARPAAPRLSRPRHSSPRPRQPSPWPPQPPRLRRQKLPNPLLPRPPAAAPAPAPKPVAAPGTTSKLQAALALTPKGTGKGEINPDAPKGFMGIPGAPSHFWLWYILWGIWVGWIFSSVGAFGGVMAGVGHISVFGLSDYASTFKKTSPTLNKLLTDSIRTSNQYLVGLSALISSFTYYRMGRLVLPLGLCLAVGGILAGYLVPMLDRGQNGRQPLRGLFRHHCLCRGLCALL